jgi:hypothetical protein
MYLGVPGLFGASSHASRVDEALNLMQFDAQSKLCCQILWRDDSEMEQIVLVVTAVSPRFTVSTVS